MWEWLPRISISYLSSELWPLYPTTNLSSPSGYQPGITSLTQLKWIHQLSPKLAPPLWFPIQTMTVSTAQLTKEEIGEVSSLPLPPPLTSPTPQSTAQWTVIKSRQPSSLRRALTYVQCSAFHCQHHALCTRASCLDKASGPFLHSIFHVAARKIFLKNTNLIMLLSCLNMISDVPFLLLKNANLLPRLTVPGLTWLYPPR